MDEIGNRILELKKKKKELEKKIKEMERLAEGCIRCNDVKYFIERYPTGKVEHKVSVVSIGRRNGMPQVRWHAVVTAENREDCHKGLVKLIEDLVDLNEKMMEESDGADDDI